MNSRLLHAAARGARIQVLCDEWEEDRCVMVWDLQHGQYGYRIHPDDEHLAYGPVSTALLGIAEEDFDVYHHNEEYTYAAYELVDFLEPSWKRNYSTTEHRSTFLLLMAEYCADLGL